MEIWEIKDYESSTVKEINRISLTGLLMQWLSSCRNDSGKKKLINKCSLKSRGIFSFSSSRPSKKDGLFSDTLGFIEN